MRQCATLLVLCLLSACQPETSTYQQKMNHLLSRQQMLAADFTDCPRTSTTAFPQLVSNARCLYFERPENPDDPGARTLRLKVMVLPAVRSRPEPDALVILVGGPGQAASEAGLMPAQVLARARQYRDVILLDQRGTGELSPFDCEFVDESLAPDAGLEELLVVQARMLGNCLGSIQARPEFYTTDIAVADLEALRTHLGYSALNLWGGSYGTRVALAYLAAWPQHTRSVVLDGVAPPAIRLPLYVARDASAALERVFSQCESDPACNARFPELRQEFASLLEQLEEPRQISLQNFRSGETEDVRVDASLLRVLVRSLLYSRESDRLLPMLISRFNAGDFQGLSTLLETEADINQGMFLSVVCSEDVSLITAQERQQALAEGSLLGTEYLVTPTLAACEQWPRRPLEPGYFDAVQSDVPALIFSGALDPVTPPRWGEEVAEGLSNARHFVVDGVAHITLPYGCVGELVSDFVNDPDPQALDAQCLDELQPRPFFLDYGGSVPGND